LKFSFQITGQILDRIAAIERLIGRVEGLDQAKPQPHLRKSNRIRTVQGSLAIEGNTLSEDQVTALFEGRTVLGPKNEIHEVLNAIEVYRRMGEFKPRSLRSLLRAHRLMMDGLLASAGSWRSGNVGVLHGSRISHVAPRADRVPYLMKGLFEFLKGNDCHPLIQGAVCHYELEFIHPFEDGNGRIGRFWHSLLLTNYQPIFEFTPVESLIKEHQSKYYEVLGIADRAGESTAFIDFSLEMVHRALDGLVDAIRPEPSTAKTRLERAQANFGQGRFFRKDYRKIHKTISTATASRDLQVGVQSGLLVRQGDKAAAVYRFLAKAKRIQDAENYPKKGRAKRA
jgi:Fic family protein